MKGNAVVVCFVIRKAVRLSNLAPRYHYAFPGVLEVVPAYKPAGAGQVVPALQKPFTTQPGFTAAGSAAIQDKTRVSIPEPVIGLELLIQYLSRCRLRCCHLVGN